MCTISLAVTSTAIPQFKDFGDSKDLSVKCFDIPSDGSPIIPDGIV